MFQLLIKDETAIGKTLNEMELSLPSSTITVKELIYQRVLAEVKAFNKKTGDYFYGLVRPKEAEVALNGYRMKDSSLFVDPEKQYYVALDAFQKNGFFILINDRQVEDLDEALQLSETTQVSFVKLTQLVGG